MAVKIRLTRFGRRNRPVWRVIAVDSRKRRDGAFLDNLGTYDPIKKEIIQLYTEKIDDWISKGAQCSDSVRKIIRMKAASNPAS